MKNMWKCEFCGKTSEDYEEIAKCERMHYHIPRGWLDIDGLNEKLEKATEYKDASEEPTTIHIVMERTYWDDEGNYHQEKRCGKYKLISSYEMPLEITND